MMNTLPFHDLKFGLESAEREASRFPELLLSGFYDPFNICREIEKGNIWMILGPKGAGKSAILEHIRLRSQQNPNWFVRKINLNEFPFIDLAGIDVGGETAQSRVPAIWSYLLLLEFMASLEKDQGAPGHRDRNFKVTVDALKGRHLLPVDNIRDTVFKLAHVDLKAHPPGLEAGVSFERISNSYPFYAVTDAIKRLVANFETDSLHFLFVDGLDSLTIGEDDTARWQILTGLMIAANSLSNIFHECGSAARIAVSCRSDLYFGLDIPDARKLLDGSSVILDWFPSSRQPQDSHLFDLAEHKASVGAGRKVANLVEEYLPREVWYGRKGEEIDSYLMSYTRYTPRDYLKLLSYIAHHSPTRGLPVSRGVVEGAKDYAAAYFVDEVRSGLFLALGRIWTPKFMDLLHTLNGNRFFASTLRSAASADRRYRDLDLVVALHQMHRIGAIANSTSTHSNPYLNFIYQNPRARLDLNQEIVLHNALTRGMNRPRQRASSGGGRQR
ncbi:hypothetical protein ABT263_10320 [Kitasatospora sp. NPDC001603]|uniref:P-loop ATPase, Sll1717 family n=1 Tax=Kitasatospora sp. NPDC001603 TaxID=3154388 RepID=UPI00332081E3